MMNWENKKVIITGGSSGIGKQLVSDLSKNGAKIAFCGLEEQLVHEVVTTFDVYGFTTDLCLNDNIHDFFEKSIEYLGGIDILINNAGYVIAENFEDLKREHFEKMFAINTIAPAILSQLTIPYFKRQNHGDIVNIGATGGAYAFEKGTAYSASKAALNIVSKNLNLEFRKHSIRTFHIDPSWCTDTNNNNYGGHIPRNLDQLIPEDITQLIINLLEMNRRGLVPQMSIWGSKP
jgi:3-oxoacyl-[acyl-carrier protein] reductase